ncbi:MAG: CotH kinase family protein [Saprospirales bacterium]|nr:CotH kinase family protein [Saprospirales bacterium]
MKFSPYPLFLSAFLLPLALFSQTPFPDLAPVFKDDVIPRIDILIPPDSLDIMLESGNEQSNYHWHGTFLFDNGTMKDTVENIGFRLRGNTSRYADKKSFKVSFNTYETGRQWEGLEKLNLNGEHNDPTVARSKICWDLLRSMKVPASRSNHVDLYINGDFYGLYINVEHVDDEFVQLRFGNDEGNLYKCTYPADLVYKGANPNLYKETFNGRRAYELTTNEDVDDYSDLAHFIDVLNNTPIAQLPCELEKVFEVDNYLKALAFDVLSGNWDGPVYNKNNFYLYHNQATGKFEYIPYDLDNTLGIDWLGQDWEDRDIYDWSPNDPRPLYDRILAVSDYRDRFSYYMDQFMDEIFAESALFPYIETMRDMITPSAEDDPYRPLDWGFTTDDFFNSYEEELPFFQTPIGLKPYITERRNSALQQLDLNNIEPILSGVGNNHPSALQDISIFAYAEDDGSLVSVEACYQLNGQNLSCVEMFDDGLHADGLPGDGIYGAVIPALNQQAEVDYYVQATDNSGKESRQPVCGTKKIFIGNASVPLVLNELMASNTGIITDEAGEYDDWIEIFSLSDVPVFLGNYHLSDNEADPTKWPMPDIWIQPGQYLLFWADEDQEQGELHTNFKLSADGEFVGIFAGSAENYALIDGISFGQLDIDAAFGRLPNGTGPFQAVYPTPGAINQAPDAVEDLDQSSRQLKVFPNPFSDVLTLEWELTGQTKADLVLRNVLGTAVLERKAEGLSSTLIISGLPAGTYIVEVLFPTGQRLIKKVSLIH